MPKKKQHRPNIEAALDIEVTKSGKQWRADPKALPGMPLCGVGKTRHAALYNLCVNWLYDAARYNFTPDSRRDGTLCYVPMILKALQEDLNKV